MARQFEPIRFIVPGFCVEGLSILAGRPKLGKSRLVLDWLLAVSAGGYAMGTVPVEQGDCLYLALEDSPRRLQSRITELTGGIRKSHAGGRLDIWTKAPRSDQKLVDDLDTWAQGVIEPRLIAIDVFAKIRPEARRSEGAYDADYRAIAPLQEWAGKNHLTLVVVHHTRKATADDPLEMLNGTNGLAGAADTVLVLDRDAYGTKLYVRGRDLEENEVSLEFNGGCWKLIGDAADARMSEQRRQVMMALQSSGEPLGPKEIAEIIGMKVANVRALLHKLGVAGEVRKLGYGKYSVAACPLEADHTGYTGHSSGADNEPA
jgi:hypothetical protein